ncbi:hypothetical protein LZ575_15265 [Antarcticibacterium sp. 1MA-6-2]|uniref:hypothetical protein n=1 Tax=Antarcticibacterium sp. 1MA-6-2 TaxID=2908210 RepID=UPI001F18791B|nr:hypothetical protein [Antarcticibacterium sp. 1MA-6-2]UJH90231.1 hypothetical protein LZ575_15265 [Antarcticibacterium sp. 1MA-6-2]
MKQQFLRFVVKLIPLTLVLFLIQYVLINYFLKETSLYYSTYSIYLFHFFSTLIIYGLLILVHHHFKDKTGFAFMGAGLIKMFAAIVFLLPMLLNNTSSAFFNLLTFFIPYFLYLVFETFYAVKLINS